MHMIDAETPRRIALVDVARGLALVAMFVFHGAWDVSFFHIVRFDPGQSVGWTIFARAIAGSFLFVSGVSLVLSTRRGFRPRPYFRRLALVVGAAALVSAATYFVLPQGWVFFGILHQIALASVLALPFLRLPSPIVLLASAFFFVLPRLFRSELFAEPALWWVGLAPAPPSSFDYVPLFPWFGAFLLGVFAARLAVAQGLDRRLQGWAPQHWPGRLLAFGGRHSLAVYLIHQPVLFGFFFVVAHVLVPNATIDAALANCQDRCVQIGNDSVGCGAYCRCVFDDAATEGLLEGVLSDSLDPRQSTRIQDLARICSQRTLSPAAGAVPGDG